jgi:hypothetical protein
MFKRLLLVLLILPFCVYGDEFRFDHDVQGWSGDFSDYPLGDEYFYELSWGWENLPKPIDQLTKGIFLNGNNHSDDLFMFVKRKITGLQPNTLYDVEFSVVIETNAPQNSCGIGGASGECVYFKAGGSTEEPVKVLDHGFYHLNVDKGNQSEGGKNAQVIGNLAHPSVDLDNVEYHPKMLSSPEPFSIQTDSKGSLWIFLGTDSGFEGLTKFYIADVHVEFLKNEKKSG